MKIDYKIENLVSCLTAFVLSAENKVCNRGWIGGGEGEFPPTPLNSKPF